MPNVQFPSSAAVKVANIWNTDHCMADEGSFFIAQNPTIGTGIAMTTSVVRDDPGGGTAATNSNTRPTMLITNQNSTSDGSQKRIYLRYLKMSNITQAPTSATTGLHYSFRGDANPNRYTSGGTLITPVNINMDSSQTSKAQVYFGAITAAAISVNSRLFSAGVIAYGLQIIGDQWIFTFGSFSMPTNVLGATGLKQVTVPCGPIVLGPGHSVSLDLWETNLAAAPQFEFELGYVERPAGQ